MCEDNFILLNRRLLKNDLWTKEPFTYGQAWVDLLLRTNHKEKLITTRNNNEVKISRGECGYSIKALSDIWHWSRGKINTFLKRLEDRKMVEIRQECNHTIIKVLNYEKYQVSSDNLLDNLSDNSTDNLLDNLTQTKNDKRMIKECIKKEKEKKEKTQANLDEVINELNLSEDWKNIFQEWLDYKKVEKNETYKSNVSLKACINKVYKESNGNIYLAKQAIQNSIANTWKGIIFTNNNYGNKFPQQQTFTGPKLEYV